MYLKKKRDKIGIDDKYKKELLLITSIIFESCNVMNFTRLCALMCNLIYSLHYFIFLLNTPTFIHLFYFFQKKLKISYMLFFIIII